MICPKCGATAPAASKFCTICGQKFDAAAPVHQPPPRLAPKQEKALPLVGTTLSGRFRVESQLGEGGFGVVYKATQLSSGRAVALKVLHPSLADDPNVVARFEREGQVLCQLKDPHTITTFDFEKSPEGIWFIAMELLQGKCLYDVANREKPMRWQRVAKIIRQMCSALGEAHAQGIVHRDLKPENVYLEARGDDPEFVKVLDFGIAKLVRGDGDPKAPQLTASGQTLGTLEYMSPEQLMGGKLDGRSDIYALGVLAYEMLVGHTPFPDATSPATLITAQYKRVPQKPSEVATNREIPTALDEIVLACLAKDKDQRFASASALANALSSLLADDAPSIRPPSEARERRESPSAARAQVMRPASVLAPATASQTRWWLLALGIVVVLSISITLLVVR